MHNLKKAFTAYHKMYSASLVYYLSLGEPFAIFWCHFETAPSYEKSLSFQLYRNLKLWKKEPKQKSEILF
jgi:hypothetical protein